MNDAPAYAILRWDKIKSTSQFRRIEYHKNHREKLHLEHKELSAYNFSFHSKNLHETTIKRRFDERTRSIKKIRKNAVLGFEVIATFSPTAAASIDLNSWARATTSFVCKTFGGGKDCLIDARLDYDESTPHMHFVVVPIEKTPAGEKLNALGYVNGPKACRQIQTDYAEQMQRFGLRRGRERKKGKPHRKHYPCGDFWKQKEIDELQPVFKNNEEVVK